ncbi:amino acid adenylation domain-containing protein [Streptomyces sp. yr375]|uniref:AMP-binding protein n=1 Tax=Streptomyces sp. yr375 TaxID=1761906 RepID=UPI0008ADA839|nr:AMP-binding protein [Streptomyces sp. yr375]SER47354.1 amino acid adenylation domain-containing protein [Streptomyces sp. yr375]
MGGLDGPALHARFLRGLHTSPGREAVRVGSDAITYEAAHRTALRWAGAIVAAAPGQPRAVGVLAAKGIPACTGILAALYSGSTVVPLRPDFPVARTRQMLDATGLTALLVDEQSRRLLPELVAGQPDLTVLTPGRAVGVEPVRTVPLDGVRALDAPLPVSPADTAYVLFTSGSTGRPKSVPISHGSTRHYFELLDARYDFTAQDVFSQTFDLNFDCALFDLFCAWGAGATALAVPLQAYRDLPGFVAASGMSVWFSTPSSISLVRRTGGLGEAAMPGLRWSFFAGEALRCADAADWQRAAPRSVVENLYGPTELTVTVAAHRWSAERTPALAVNGVVPIGAIHEGHPHLLLDEDGEESRTEGELCVAGPQTTAGYLDPGDDDGRFLERSGRRWYRTGDRVRRVHGGELAYLGRLDGQVQIQGWRVELAEIDHALRGCAGVAEAVTVTARADGRDELVVFYTGVPVPPGQLAKDLTRVLPQGLVPRHYRHLTDIPLNSNRKTDRPTLRSLAAELIGSREQGTR